MSINVYSKSDHWVGRTLSNWADTPFIGKIGNGGYIRFQCVESWWLCFKSGKSIEECLKLKWNNLHGWESKHLMRNVSCVRKVTPEILKKVYILKLNQNPIVKQALLDSGDENFDHYYVYNNKIIKCPKYLWTATLWAELRSELRSELR